MNNLTNFNQLIKNFNIESYLKNKGIKYSSKSTYFLIEDCIFCKKNKKMILNRDHKFFKCFVCGISGGLIKFFQLVDKISYSEAISYLSGFKPYIQTKELDVDKLSIYLLKSTQNELTLPYFDRINLNDDSEVSSYLLKIRKYTQELIDLFDIRYNSFQKRVVFPIKDHLNRLVGWQSRDITGINPIKILTQPTGFKKNLILYNFHRVKFESFVTIVEGPVDCHKSYQFNSVAILGKIISKEQIDLLMSMDNLKTIYIGLDPDASYESSRLISEFCPYYDIKILNLPKGVKDLGDCTIDEANYYLENSEDFNKNYGKLSSCLV